MELRGGRRGSFEVTIDGELVHSKLATGTWSDTKKVLDAVARRLGR